MKTVKRLRLGFYTMEFAVVAPIVLAVMLGSIQLMHVLQVKNAVDAGVESVLRCLYTVNGSCVSAPREPGVYYKYYEDVGEEIGWNTYVNYDAVEAWMERPQTSYYNVKLKQPVMVYPGYSRISYSYQKESFPVTGQVDYFVMTADGPYFRGSNPYNFERRGIPPEDYVVYSNARDTAYPIEKSFDLDPGWNPTTGRPTLVDVPNSSERGIGNEWKRTFTLSNPPWPIPNSEDEGSEDPNIFIHNGREGNKPVVGPFSPTNMNFTANVNHYLRRVPITIVTRGREATGSGTLTVKLEYTNRKGEKKERNLRGRMFTGAVGETLNADQASLCVRGLSGSDRRLIDNTTSTNQIQDTNQAQKALDDAFLGSLPVSEQIQNKAIAGQDCRGEFLEHHSILVPWGVPITITLKLVSDNGNRASWTGNYLRIYRPQFAPGSFQAHCRGKSVPSSRKEKAKDLVQAADCHLPSPSDDMAFVAATSVIGADTNPATVITTGPYAAECALSQAHAKALLRKKYWNDFPASDDIESLKELSSTSCDPVYGVPQICPLFDLSRNCGVSETARPMTIDVFENRQPINALTDVEATKKVCPYTANSRMPWEVSRTNEQGGKEVIGSGAVDSTSVIWDEQDLPVLKDSYPFTWSWLKAHCLDQNPGLPGYVSCVKNLPNWEEKFSYDSSVTKHFGYRLDESTDGLKPLPWDEVAESPQEKWECDDVKYSCRWMNGTASNDERFKDCLVAGDECYEGYFSGNAPESGRAGYSKDLNGCAFSTFKQLNEKCRPYPGTVFAYFERDEIKKDVPCEEMAIAYCTGDQKRCNGTTKKVYFDGIYAEGEMPARCKEAGVRCGRETAGVIQERAEVFAPDIQKAIQFGLDEAKATYAKAKICSKKVNPDTGEREKEPGCVFLSVETVPPVAEISTYQPLQEVIVTAESDVALFQVSNPFGSRNLIDGATFTFSTRKRRTAEAHFVR